MRDSTKRNQTRATATAALLLLLGFGSVEAFAPLREFGGTGRRKCTFSSSSNRISSLHAVSSVSIRPILASNDNIGTSPKRRMGRRKMINKAEIEFAKKIANNLESLGIPFGLRRVLLQSRSIYKKRIWIIDNSGSMAIEDGNCLLLPPPGATTSTKSSSSYDDDDDITLSSSPCSRWNEVQETVNCHAFLAGSIHAPTDFRLLNPPQSSSSSSSSSNNNNGGGAPKTVRVGYGRHRIKDCKRVQSCLSRTSPNGETPLATLLIQVRNEVVEMLPQLQESNQKVAIVIATDGCNYNKHNLGSEITEIERNQAMLHAIKSLQGLPVTLVTRLCTDHQPLLDFYNVLDENLSDHRYGIDLDVIEYHQAEAEQVYQHNPWLNYASVLHRIREMGQDHALFDLLDERPFTRGEIKEFCTLLFGYDDWPDDWILFLQVVHTIQQMEKTHYNPITKTVEPWVDIQKLFAIGWYWTE